MKLYLDETRWYRSKDKVYACGKLFYEDVWLFDQSLADFLTTITTQEALQALLKGAEGFFSFILIEEEKLYIVSDLVRSIPVFWKIENANELWVSDNPYSLLSPDTTIDNIAQEEMMLSGYVIGKRTIYSDIFQTEAGKYISFSAPYATELIDEVCYIRFPQEYIKQESEDFYLEKLDFAYQISIKHMIRFLQGRQVVIPLSGGLDSRFLLAILNEMNYRNILTFTYGKKETQEVLISKAIANHFGVKWINVPYLNGEMQKLYQEQFEKICLKTSMGMSTPCLQDWYALEYLKCNGLLEKDAVVVPGHAISSVVELLDKKLTETGAYTKQDIINQTLQGHFCLMHTAWAESKRTIVDELNRYYQFERAVYNNWEAYVRLGDFGYRERQTKYILNSVRIYEYYRLDWYLPFWTPSLVQLWGEMPLDFCFHRKIYYDLIKKRYPELQKKIKVFGHDSEQQKHVPHASDILPAFMIFCLRPVYRRLNAIKKRYTDNINLFGYISAFRFYCFILAGNCSPVSMWSYMTQRLLKQQLKRDMNILGEEE